MKRFLFLLKVVLTNALVAFLNLFIWRDKRIWLVGSWSGYAFNDNSRYLYQYLFENKEKYGIKKVVWFTRSKEVFDLMQNLGYSDVLLDKGPSCFYYHIKSGVHIICNSVGDTKRPGDINTFYSFGAKKIQLWHGVGIKACGYLRKEKEKGLKNSFSKIISNRFLKPGMWGRCFQLATSEENKRVAIEDFGVMRERVIVAAYPRNCECPRLTLDEKRFLDDLLKISEGKRIIAYLPTFREDSKAFVTPTNVDGFSLFLQKNNYLWIQKNHLADKHSKFLENDRNVVSLPSNFDVNVLYKYIDLLVTDYSSAATDAMFFGKRIVNYCPDYNYYKNEDRGFVNDFDKYSVGCFVDDPNNLFGVINKCMKNAAYLDQQYIQTKRFLLGEKVWSFGQITDEIIKRIKLKTN